MVQGAASVVVQHAMLLPFALVVYRELDRHAETVRKQRDSTEVRDLLCQRIKFEAQARPPYEFYQAKDALCLLQFWCNSDRTGENAWLEERLRAHPGGPMQGCEAFEEEAAEEAREHAHGQEEVGLAGDPARPVRRQAAAWHDDMDMRVMGQRRAPGVQHGGEADARAEMFRVGGDRDQRLGGGPEQEVVDGGLVLERDRADRRRQGEDDVIIGDRQEFGLALGEPLPRRRALALRAVTRVATYAAAQFGWASTSRADRRQPDRGRMGRPRGCGRNCRRRVRARSLRSRSTCPPSAAVRQVSIADMTFSWPRPTWPALALRHAAPWARKTLATSRRHASARAERRYSRGPGVARTRQARDAPAGS